MEGDLMPGIMGAAAGDQHWTDFKSSLQQAWLQDIPDAFVLTDAYDSGNPYMHIYT